MARIEGIDPGLIPKELPKATVHKVVVKDKPIEHNCEACGGLLPTRRAFGEKVCVPCMTFFGDDRLNMGGATNVTPEESRRKLADAKQDKWVMLLRCMGLGAPDGATIQLEAGDIIKVARIGFDKKGGECSSQRTKLTFSITCMVGPYEVTLFPHEFSAIGFPVIMEMLRAKEIEEQFVCDGDENGHFSPSAEMREQIKAAFGHLIGAR